MKLLQRFFVLTLLLLTLTNGLRAQIQPGSQNVVQLSASATIEVPQDWLSLTLNSVREGSDATTVQTQLKQALEAALVLARSSVQLGQFETRTGNFSIYPRYGKDSKVNGWQGSAELVLEGRDFAQISTIAGRIQTMTMGQIGFSLSRELRQKFEADTQAQAIERFKNKANAIAQQFGFTGYALREISVSSADQGYVPRPRMMAMEARGAAMADAPMPVEAGRSTVQVTISGSIQLK
jgi:predicted secreted protein